MRSSVRARSGCRHVSPSAYGRRVAGAAPLHEASQRAREALAQLEAVVREIHGRLHEVGPLVKELMEPELITVMGKENPFLLVSVIEMSQ